MIVIVREVFASSTAQLTYPRARRRLSSSAFISLASLGASGVAVDGAGNLFIADSGNRRIRNVVFPQK